MSSKGPLTDAAGLPVPASAMQCPSCGSPVQTTQDKFCRTCGLRIQMVCSKCGQTVRPADRYCTHCGARRWALFEMWRHGILHRHPGFVLGTTVLVGVAYVGLYVWVKSRPRLRF